MEQKKEEYVEELKQERDDLKKEMEELRDMAAKIFDEQQDRISVMRKEYIRLQEAYGRLTGSDDYNTYESGLPGAIIVKDSQDEEVKALCDMPRAEIIRSQVEEHPPKPQEERVLFLDKFGNIDWPGYDDKTFELGMKFYNLTVQKGLKLEEVNLGNQCVSKIILVKEGTEDNERIEEVIGMGYGDNSDLSCVNAIESMRLSKQIRKHLGLPKPSTSSADN